MAAPSFAPSSKYVDPLQPLRDALAKPDGARLICLCGSERFLIDRAVDLIKETVLVPATRDPRIADVIGGPVRHLCSPGNLCRVMRCDGQGAFAKSSRETSSVTRSAS